ncbi:MAG: hypothetical protein JSS72_05500 [Armatimonadetes bacterium]|nr:hypothetical protein [Armatimonadota bacterium]
MKSLTPYFVLASCLLAPFGSAHFVWLTVDAKDGKATMQLADSPGKDIAPILYRIQSRIRLKNIGALSDAQDHALMTAPVVAKGKPAALEALYGLHGTSLVHWSAKGVSKPEQAVAALKTAGEIVLKKSGSGWKGVVLNGGKPVKDVSVETYVDGGDEVDVKVGNDGSFALPHFHRSLALGAMVHIPKGGDYEGKKYTEYLEVISLCINLPSSVAAAPEDGMAAHMRQRDALFAKLDLTPKQKAQIKQFEAELAAELKKVPAGPDGDAKRQALMMNHVARFQTILTQEQKMIYREEVTKLGHGG